MTTVTYYSLLADSSKLANDHKAAGAGSKHTSAAYVPEYRADTPEKAVIGGKAWPGCDYLIIRYVADSTALALWDAGNGPQPDAIGYWDGKRRSDFE